MDRDEDSSIEAAAPQRWRLRPRANRYAAQRRLGFVGLRFSDELEREYREYRLPMLRRRLAALFHIAAAGLFLYVVVDMTAKVSVLGGLSIGFVMAAIAIVMLLVVIVRQPQQAQSLDTSVTLGIAAFGLCVVGSVLAAGPDGPFGSIVTVLIALYFVAGLPTRKVVLAALVISLAYVVGLLSLPTPLPGRFPFQMLFLALANLIGVVGEFQIEHEARRTFLLQMELRDLAQHDGLTHLYNRRAFRRHLQTLWRQAERDGKALGLMLIDLDRLKQINDGYGHSAGDACIKSLAGILRRRVKRPLDAAGRLGGDEFVACWYDVDPQWFGALGEAIRREAERAGDGGLVPHYTISIGATHVLPGSATSVTAALEQVDVHLYAAKAAARNRMVFDPSVRDAGFEHSVPARG